MTRTCIMEKQRACPIHLQLPELEVLHWAGQAFSNRVGRTDACRLNNECFTGQATPWETFFQKLQEWKSKRIGTFDYECTTNSNR